jgi:hypothetical protein
VLKISDTNQNEEIFVLSRCLSRIETTLTSSHCSSGYEGTESPFIGDRNAIVLITALDHIQCYLNDEAWDPTPTASNIASINPSAISSRSPSRHPEEGDAGELVCYGWVRSH